MTYSDTPPLFPGPSTTWGLSTFGLEGDVDSFNRSFCTYIWITLYSYAPDQRTPATYTESDR